MSVRTLHLRLMLNAIQCTKVHCHEADAAAEPRSILLSSNAHREPHNELMLTCLLSFTRAARRPRPERLGCWACQCLHLRSRSGSYLNGVQKGYVVRQGSCRKLPSGQRRSKKPAPLSSAVPWVPTWPHQPGAFGRSLGSILVQQCSERHANGKASTMRLVSLASS